MISYFDLTPDTVSENALVVYGGFEGCKQEYVTLISPKGKHKSKVSSKTTVAKQHAADQAAKNRTLTRVRNIIERVFPVAIKSWEVLGGKTLHFAYLDTFLPTLILHPCSTMHFEIALTQKGGHG